MKRPVSVIAVVVLVMLAVAAAAPRDDARKTLFGPLEVGQQVGLKESPTGYTITLVAGVGLGHKVIEIAPDFIVLEDATATTQTRIPVTAIRAVVVTRLPKDR